MMRIEQGLPLAQLNELARLESYNKHYYRPVTYIHKWWARRLHRWHPETGRAYS